ncbi:hypothetical protein [Bacillus cereus]|uniref:hypothetical protein n=1 Tax=Bacillus cereus TaxID=1396 RepID=UPI00187AF7F3|nr:hypothetical protein [Bacillus cereus]MBE7097013.1 hypothetical protein [Bacillus cereus]
MGNLKNIKAADFNLEESFEDDIFMEVNGGGTSSADWATNLPSIITGLTALTGNSNASNTYTELGCCRA